MRLWLDDIRPAPREGGWHHVKTVDEAKELLLTGEVMEASLDHDLGPHCDHFGTGYNLVCWMEETGNWPKSKPRVHSANPVGRARMQSVIDKHFG